MFGWLPTWMGCRNRNRTLEESHLHINILELRAAIFSLKVFAHHLRSITVLIHIDTSLLQFINKRGGTHSLPLCQEAITLWKWVMKRQLNIQTEYIPGRENTIADSLSRKEETDWGDWKLEPRQFRKTTHYLNTYPVIDILPAGPTTNYQTT